MCLYVCVPASFYADVSTFRPISPLPPAHTSWGAEREGGGGDLWHAYAHTVYLCPQCVFYVCVLAQSKILIFPRQTPLQGWHTHKTLKNCTNTQLGRVFSQQQWTSSSAPLGSAHPRSHMTSCFKTKKEREQQFALTLCFSSLIFTWAWPFLHVHFIVCLWCEKSLSVNTQDFSRGCFFTRFQAFPQMWNILWITTKIMTTEIKKKRFIIPCCLCLLLSPPCSVSPSYDPPISSFIIVLLPVLLISEHLLKSRFLEQSYCFMTTLCVQWLCLITCVHHWSLCVWVFVYVHEQTSVPKLLFIHGLCACVEQVSVKLINHSQRRWRSCGAKLHSAVSA